MLHAPHSHIVLYCICFPLTPSPSFAEEWVPTQSVASIVAVWLCRSIVLYFPRWYNLFCHSFFQCGEHTVIEQIVVYCTGMFVMFLEIEHSTTVLYTHSVCVLYIV